VLALGKGAVALEGGLDWPFDVSGTRSVGSALIYLCLSINQSIYFNVSIHPSIYLSIDICLSILLSIYLYLYIQRQSGPKIQLMALCRKWAGSQGRKL